MMNRRNFVKNSAITSFVSGASSFVPLGALNRQKMKNTKRSFPLAITMWEFSWLERRWPGAGYEDWDKALSELVERGYDGVRIDAFPHLVSTAPEKVWGLDPHWNNQLWGSPVYNEVQVQPALNNFIKKCGEYNVKVALSTWWREDTEQTVNTIKSGRDLGMMWKKTLDSIAEEGLLDNIIFVDLSNEYSIGVWTPYLPDGTKRNSELSIRYMHESIDLLVEAYPEMPFCFSITTEFDKWKTEDVSRQDLLELHIWIANSSDFNQEVGYNFQRFGFDDYKKLQLNAQRVYREKEQHWLKQLNDRIDLAITWSKHANLPLVTTECWGPIDYRDFPLLDWDWVKEACAYGTEKAAASGRWLAISTSNFCGPQFVGMWRDVEWHRNLTDIIHNAPVDKALKETKLAKRMSRG
jgi:hypothetical protein